MACGCLETCNCNFEEGSGINISGSGATGNPIVISAVAQATFAATNADGTIDITPAGTAGHTPNFDLIIDPASTSPVTKTVDGLRIDCCTEGGAGSIEIADTDSVDMHNGGDILSADVIIDSNGGLVTTPGQGVGIDIDPSSTAPVSVSINGLKVNCCDPTDALVIPDTIVYATAGAFSFVKASYPNLKYVDVEVVGGGGGSGGVPSPPLGSAACSGGGGGGGYARKTYPASSLGASVAINVGAGGTAGTTAPTDGGDGGDSNFGFLTGNGGLGGAKGVSSSTEALTAGGDGGTGSGGDINVSGDDGGGGASVSGHRTLSNVGGGTVLAGSRGGQSGSQAGNRYGGGASGEGAAGSQPAASGSPGGVGVVIVRLIN